ncbi:hypothetical protein FBY28_0258 [Arthrobacter sp. SLBN-53]|nr:hypothetical protein FBY28_0258 [Arthrobacter sp. SLBN-53]
MSVRPDNRLRDAPMQPVSCRECAASVLVRKSSWEQTSVQWDADSLTRCRERAEASAQPAATNGLGLERPGLFLACGRLRDSIERAAGTGALPVLAERES